MGRRGGLPAPPLPAGRTFGAAPADWDLTDLDGRPVSFASFRGRPLVVNIWATWCPPCVAEMPGLERLADTLAARAPSAAVLAVSTEPTATVRRFRDGKSSSALVVLTAADLPEVFLTDGIPATFVVAPDGRVVAAEVGAAAWDDPAVIAFIERLAAAPRPPNTGSSGASPAASAPPASAADVAASPSDREGSASPPPSS
jgi:thiol-disulfide isomerase/thioredoxin